MSGEEPDVAALVDRPLAERCREYKYRFAQSAVFGLPVIALAALGPSLGGPEAGRWIGLLQVLLGGWVIYVGALGMLVEAVLRRKVTSDAVVAGAALGLYLLGVAGVVWVFVTARSHGQRWALAAMIVIVCGWAGGRWLRYRRPGRADGGHV